jgi:Spy/CpxP family protein refolding chaperone
MKKAYVLMLVAAMAVFIAVLPVLGEKGPGETDPHHGACWKSGHGWGHGDMMGKGHGEGHGKRPHGWRDMTAEQKTLWKEFEASFNTETLELRQQLAVRKIELQTLWSQPDVDEARVEKLSSEVADLKAQLWKMHDKYVLKCRKAFGEKGWDCPGHGW